MDWNKILLFSILVMVHVPIVSIGQEKLAMQWENVPEEIVQGRLEPQGTASFQRFPQELQKEVREPVWQLSRNSAGLYIDFESDASDIIVEYDVEDQFSFPHMPATGVSGLDLYAMEENSGWQWVRGIYSFKDTISYRYNGIKPAIKGSLRTFRLYLPLYNTVRSLRIGVAENSIFKPIKTKEQNPIVVYGTSIVQGACASRPGLAWTSILGRYIDKPVVNLGFSGNGKLEPEVIDFILRASPSIIVLDCMPNFRDSQKAEESIIKSIERIRAVNDTVPILLIEHAGYSDGFVQNERLEIYENLNKATQRAFTYLKSQGINFLHMVKKEDINLNKEGFVDGTHPNDHGMVGYARAISKALTEKGILD